MVVTNKPHLELTVSDLLTASFDGIIISSLDGKVILANPAIERIMGISLSEMLGKSGEQLVAKGIIPFATCYEALKKKQPFTKVQEYSTGKTAIVTSSLILDQQGQVKYVITNIRDISLMNYINYKDQFEKAGASCRSQPLKDFPDMVFASQTMLNVIELATSLAQVETTVLIYGETGVGKDVIARYIHQNSPRKNGRFIKVNCGALPENLMEAELFGYEPGAFTGAQKRGKPGLAELANEGTLFLDEIGDLPLRLQTKLLEFMQDFEFFRLGGTEKIHSNTRIIAATNKDLPQLVKKKRFRADLYFRVNVAPIEVPPLRKRTEDIMPLVRLFLNQFNQKYGFQKVVTDQLLNCLQEYSWPGNVRELQNLIENLVVTTKENKLSPKHLPAAFNCPTDSADLRPIEIKQIIPLQKALEETERQLFLRAAMKYKSTYKVAKALGTSQSTASRKIRKYTAFETNQ
jgi:PAS domain S-box-containing protein